MRIVFCGSGEFATPTLRALNGSEHRVACVLTQPARPAGRGGKLRSTPVAETARQLGLEAVETGNINAPAMIETIRTHRPDAMLVADFGQMVRAAARQTAALGAFNLHGSILPELRGAAPVNWAIIRGFERTGVTVFSLVDKMDAGEVYGTAATEIARGETAEELHERLAVIGAELVLRVLRDLAAGTAVGAAQDEAAATLAPKLKKEDGRIDWTAAAAAVCGRVNGTWPWPGARATFVHAGRKAHDVTIARAVPEGGEGPSTGSGQAGPAGTLDGELLVAAGRGRVRILDIQPAGKRKMTWKDFCNGHRAAPGDGFVSVQP